MNDSIYQARMELFKTLNLPVSRASTQLFRWRLRCKLGFWELSLRSIYAFKRLVDIFCSLLALVLLTPFFLAIMLAILIEDGHPFFFVQQRVGLNGRIFHFYKFRSMVKNAEQLKNQLLKQNESGDGVIFKMKRDPRI